VTGTPCAGAPASFIALITRAVIGWVPLFYWPNSFTRGALLSVASATLLLPALLAGALRDHAGARDQEGSGDGARHGRATTAP